MRGKWVLLLAMVVQTAAGALTPADLLGKWSVQTVAIIAVMYEGYSFAAAAYISDVAPNEKDLVAIEFLDEEFVSLRWRDGTTQRGFWFLSDFPTPVSYDNYITFELRTSSGESTFKDTMAFRAQPGGTISACGRLRDPEHNTQFYFVFEMHREE